MATYDLEGTVKVVFDTMTFASGFSKREFVVTTDDDKFPQDIKMACLKEKAALLDDVEAGDRVKVTFDLRGNEYKDRYYVDLTAWRVDKVGGEGASPAGAGGQAEDHPPLPAEQAEPADDDFPF